MIEMNQLILLKQVLFIAAVGTQTPAVVTGTTETPAVVTGTTETPKITATSKCFSSFDRFIFLVSTKKIKRNIHEKINAYNIWSVSIILEFDPG